MGLCWCEAANLNLADCPWRCDRLLRQRDFEAVLLPECDCGEGPREHGVRVSGGEGADQHLWDTGRSGEGHSYLWDHISRRCVYVHGPTRHA